MIPDHSVELSPQIPSIFCKKLFHNCSIHWRDESFAQFDFMLAQCNSEASALSVEGGGVSGVNGGSQLLRVLAKSPQNTYPSAELSPTRFQIYNINCLSG